MNLHDLPIDLAPRSVDRVRSLMRLLALLAIVAGLAALPWSAKAATSNCSTPGGSIDFGTVPVPANLPNGAVLAEKQVTLTFNCSSIPVLTGNQGLYVQAGDLATRHSSDTGSNGIVYATSVSGIALKLTGSPFQAWAKSCLRCGPGSSPGFEIGPIASNGGSGSISNTFTAQLIKVGATTSGTLNAIRLMRFYWYEYGVTPSSGPMSGVLQFNATTVRAPTCTVNTESVNLAVTLPTVSMSALRTNGATAARTPFYINLTCEAGARATIEMDSTRAHNTITGLVRAPTTPPPSGSWAGNIGVQILNGGFQPVDFGEETSLGTAPGAAWRLPYHAQYYRFGNTATAGPVKATVTFLMTYD